MEQDQGNSCSSHETGNASHQSTGKFSEEEEEEEDEIENNEDIKPPLAIFLQTDYNDEDKQEEKPALSESSRDTCEEITIIKEEVTDERDSEPDYDENLSETEGEKKSNYECENKIDCTDQISSAPELRILQSPLCEKIYSREVIPHGGSSSNSRHAHTKFCTCDVCKKMFSAGNTLPSGAPVQVQEGKKLHECEICHKSFTLRQSLGEHMRTHTGEKPYACEVCGKSFSQQGNLSVHSRIHSGKRPYECPLCGKTFIQKSHISNHLRRHERKTQKETETGVKEVVKRSTRTAGDKGCGHTCNKCSKRFSTRKSLAEHSRTHSGEKPYKCTHCDKCFSQYGNLSIHLRIHLQQRPFQCDACERSFVQKSHLDRHRFTHMENKPFSCTWCGKGFSRRENLIRHALDFHPQDCGDGLTAKPTVT